MTSVFENKMLGKESNYRYVSKGKGYYQWNPYPIEMARHAEETKPEGTCQPTSILPLYPLLRASSVGICLNGRRH
jgi:hypothetical protein